jgi:hypothetical protein
MCMSDMSYVRMHRGFVPSRAYHSRLAPAMQPSCASVDIDITRAISTRSLRSAPGRESVNWTGRNVSVPKAALVTKLVSTAQGGDLEVHGDLPDWPELRRQLQNFRALITPGGRETWAAARGHDDLVIATAMSCWFLEGRNSPGFGLFESVRLAAGGAPETFCLAVDFGQSVDPCAICAMARVPAFDRPNREKFEPVLPTVSADPGSPDNRTEWRKRFDDMAARETPDHPDVGAGGETEYVNGRNCKPGFARGSVEWQQQQDTPDA